MHAQPEIQAADQPAIDPNLLLSIFGQRPIIFHRLYIEITGSCSAAVFLAYALHTVSEFDAPEDSDGWWSKSQDQWSQETGLSRREQEGARKRLKILGILEEQKKQNAPLQFRINAQQLYMLMQHHAAIESQPQDF